VTRKTTKFRYVDREFKEYLGQVKPINLLQPFVSVLITTYQYAKYTPILLSIED
jgi:hypothetical protein